MVLGNYLRPVCAFRRVQHHNLVADGVGVSDAFCVFSHVVLVNKLLLLFSGESVRSRHDLQTRNGVEWSESSSPF